MTNKQALLSTSDRDWFENWFKREFHPDKTGPYIKDQLLFAVRAARAPLLDELEAKDKRIAELEAREVKLPKLKMLSVYLREVTMREREDILLGVKLEFHRELQAAGIRINGEG